MRLELDYQTLQDDLIDYIAPAVSMLGASQLDVCPQSSSDIFAVLVFCNA